MLVLKLARVAIVAVAVAGVAAPSAPAAAAKTICVGVVVDARWLDGPVSADCATVADGSTGYDVLKAAGHTVGFRQDGLICTIDNRPTDGCSKTDALHYWAYFHREPTSSSWSYSNEGATTYKPDNGETEGWVWRDGDMATPKDVPYTTICPQTSSPTPRPSTTHASPATASPSPTIGTTAPSPAAVHRVHRRTERKRHTPSPSTSPTATTSVSPPVTVAAVNTKPHNGSSAPPWGLIAGVAAIGVIGGAAAWQVRRRGSD